MFFVRYKFQHIKHNTMHTLFQFISRARLTLVDDNKVALCQIFIAQNALVHHLKFAFHTCTLDKNCCNNSQDRQQINNFKSRKELIAYLGKIDKFYIFV